MTMTGPPFKLTRFVIFGGLVLVASLLPICAIAQSADQRFANGLRQRRLYDLAETFCRQRLADPEIAPLEQADLVLQLIQTQVAKAAGLSLEQQPAAWSVARQTLDEFLQKNSEHPRREVLIVQNGLTLFARGQSLRQEWDLDNSRSDLKSLAAQILRDAVRELDAADRLIADLLPQRQRQRAPDELSTAQLMALQSNVQFQLAQCYLNSALLYGDDEKSARVDALTQIEERLDQLRRRVQPDDPLAWQILALRMECQRRLGRVAEAEAIGAAVDEKAIPADARGEFWTERLQVALGQNKVEDAIRWLPQVASFYATNPKLCLSLVELFLTMAAQSKDESERQTWQQRADQTIRVLETYHGTYWTRRANLLLLKNTSATQRTSSGELIVRLADELLRKKQPDEAIRMLDLAGSQASADDHPPAAAQFAIRAAQIQQQRGQFQDASDRFRLAAAAFRDQPEADDAHLSACWNLAQLIPQQPELLENYINLLREHLASWPNENTADQAAIWLVPLLARQGKWLEALNAAVRVRPLSTDFGKAAELACSAATAELARASQAEPDQLASRAKEIEQALTDWIARADAGSATDNGAAVGQLQLTRIIIALTYLGRDSPSAARDLEQLWQGSAELAAPWRENARAWQALCRTASGETVPETEVGELTPASWMNWLAVAESLRNDKNRTSLAQLIVKQYSRIADALAKGDSGNFVRWQIAEAEGLWEQGFRDQAVEQFSELSAQHPRLLDVQIRFASMLARDSSGAWSEKAIGLWRAIGAGSQPRSEVWFSAKFELARLLTQQEKLDEAEKILRYLKTVPPGWEQSALKHDFEQLLAEIIRRQDRKEKR